MVPAWIGSLLFHLLVLAALFFSWSFRSAAALPSGEREATGAIVLKESSEDGTEYFESDNDKHGDPRPEVGEEAAEAALSEQFLAASFSDARLPTLPTVSAIGPNAATGNATDPSGAELAELLGRAGARSPGFGSDPGGAAKLSLFGITDEGRRFVFVFDRSASMKDHGERPIRAAKQALVRCIDVLDKWHQFNIVFYNEKPLPWQAGKMVFADESSRASAKRFIEGVIPTGGTRHREALSTAVRLKPDVIYFLTDGDDQDRLTPSQISEITNLNQRSGAGASLHVIQFGVGARSGSGYLKDLAKQNDGQFTYINIAELPAQ